MAKGAFGTYAQGINLPNNAYQKIVGDAGGKFTAQKIAGLMAEIENRVAKSAAAVDNELIALEKSLSIDLKWDLSSYVQRVNDRNKFAADADAAISTIKDAIKLTAQMMHIQEARLDMIEKVKKSGNPSQHRINCIRQEFHIKAKELLMEYLKVKDDLQKALDFLNELEKILGDSINLSLKSIAVEKDKILPLVNRMIQIVQNALLIITQDKKQVEAILKQV